MATKGDLLNTLATYDVATLERLVKLASMIITPDEDSLVKVTFEDMVDKAHSLADTYFPEWTDRSQSDFGEFLVELFALFSEKDFWYINAFANEGFLQKASTYRGGYYHALRLGYRPSLTKASVVEFNVTFAAGSDVEIPSGSIEVVISDKTYSNTSTISVLASVSPTSKTIQFSEGVVRQESANFNGKSVKIYQSNIEFGSVTQTINGLNWDQVDTFRNSSNFSKHFLVLPEETFAEVEYGNSVNGQRPSVGDLIISRYRTCSGSLGDFVYVPGSPITVTQQPSGRSVLSVDFSSKVSSGVDIESLDSIRLKAPLDVRTNNRIINTYDCVDVLLQYPDILRATSYYGLYTFYFSIIPKKGLTLSLPEIASRLSDKVIEGFLPLGVDTPFVNINEMTIHAFVLSGYSSLDIINQIKTITVDYSSPWGRADFGRNFDLSELYNELIINIKGLQNVVFETINGSPAVSLPVTTKQITAEIDPVNINVTISTI